MKKLSDNIKSVVIVSLVLLTGILSAMRLMEIQIVGGNDIINPYDNDIPSFTYTKDIKATRGEIVDYSGNTIIANKTRTDIVLQKAFFPNELQKGNSILLNAYKELEKCGFLFESSLPISMNKPYTFTDTESSEVISKLNLNVYATAENCIDKLISDYEIDSKYSDEEKRIIAGMRYEMLVKDFSYSIDLILAEDVDVNTVVKMKELSNILKGINAVEAADREIILGDILPHEIGTVGPIYAEEYEELKDNGYALNDVLGKHGIELAMEAELRGTNGSQKITVQGDRISEVDTIEKALTGSTVKLTVNGTYQRKLQGILDNFIANFQNINSNPALKNVNCGAIVVLDAQTGAVKGMATAPTYNLIDYADKYDEILNADNNPLVNRATNGLYRPGSTFKTVTATAGLNEGFVNADTTFTCLQDYRFIDTDYSCTGKHHDIAVTRALEVSCNIYFYELSQKLTIDNITKYAKLYGLGQHTGIETGDAKGYLANPETFIQHGHPWYVGFVLQAAIGNIDCGMTPLQMAVVANTIANEGVRYKPYLVDSLYEYNSGKLVSKTQPTISEQIDLNYNYVYPLIEQGMIDASHNVPAQYSLSNLGFDVAIKTGTPQVGENNEQNSFFIGYAPADKPEIAFAGVIEGGEYSKYMIRDIILSYQECYGLNGVPPTAVLNTQSQENNTPTVTSASTTTTTGTDTSVANSTTETTTTTS